MSDTQAVLEKLLEDHRGQNNAITQGQLSDALGINPSTLRSELRRLREQRNIPIANQRDGYYIIQSKEELQEYIGHINSEIESKKNTIEHTLEAWDVFDPDEPQGIDQEEPQEKTYQCSVEGCEREMPRSGTRWPKKGPYEDQTVCARCLGKLIQKGQA